VIEALQKLKKESHELMRFRPKSLQEQQDEPVGVKRGANYAREQNERRLVDRYQNLKEEDFFIHK